MRFRTGVLAGFALGYYFGTKAGRERYEQIEEYLAQVRTSTTVRQFVSRLSERAEAGMTRGRVSVVGASFGSPSDPTVVFEHQIDPTLN